jgi:hypothetical protein
MLGPVRAMWRVGHRRFRPPLGVPVTRARITPATLAALAPRLAFAPAQALAPLVVLAPLLAVATWAHAAKADGQPGPTPTSPTAPISPPISPASPVTPLASPETLPPPAPKRTYMQYGVAFTAEAVAFAGDVCGNSNAPCILGSGGGIAIRVGWRPTEHLYLGGAYEFSKQDSNKVFLLAILQQVRFELRYYIPTGKAARPFFLVGAGAASYGNEWSVATFGPSGTFGAGLEVEFAAGGVVDLSLAYRPIYFRSFYDSTPALHDAGVSHFIAFEVALEAQDTL